MPNLQKAAMNGGYMLYIAAGIVFCLMLAQVDKTERYTGTMYIVAMAGWIGITVFCPLAFAQAGLNLRRAARRASLVSE